MKQEVIKETGNLALTAWQVFRRAHIHNGPILYLVEDYERAVGVWQNLMALRSVYMPRLIVHHEPDGKALWILLHSIPSIIVLTHDDMARYCITPDEYKAQSRAITRGVKSSPRALASQLQALGYIPRADEPAPGEFMVRGGQMVLNDSLSETHYTIEFDEQRVAQIHPFSCVVGPLHPGEGKATLWSYVHDDCTVYKEVLFGASLPDTIENVGEISPERAKQLLVEYVPQGYKVLCAGKNVDTIMRIFDLLPLTHWKHALHAISPRQRASSAFIDHEGRFIYLTDDDVIPVLAQEEKSLAQAMRPPIRGRVKEGDYLVHIDHGIGVFRGVRDLDDDGESKKYFVLEYAAGDMLYVPENLEEKLDIYLGSSNPKLNRLSTATWEETKEKAREDIEGMAQELLSIYAVREMSEAVPLLPCPEEELFARMCTFELTPDQKKCIDAVLKDLESEVPADRLICGDVGFGKTEVALRAIFRAAVQKKQVAVVCPTTVLAHQHHETFLNRLEQFGIKVALLSRLYSKDEQKKILDELAQGAIDVIVGTHRLLQHDVQFCNLGLAIIDEEQRFGIKQKEHMKKMRSGCHVLSLSATPIPRTLNLALSGLRSMSIIATPPPGRVGIETYIGRFDGSLVARAVRDEMSRGGQIFYLYNKVETMELKLRELEKKFPGVRIGVAHGQMPQELLLGTMDAFARGDMDILLATTIIENGLDLPNVNTLIVEDAVQFGLSSLHQLRGRIGRSNRKAYAYFFYTSPKLGDKSRERLQALENAADLGAGFSIAMRDMEIRGVGSVLGARQHGHVIAIGLNLYLELLEKEVHRLRGQH